MGAVYLVAGILASYLLGSVPFAYVFGRLLRGVDVRTVGSGNVGGTNLMRAAGKGWGALVIALDLGKGACAAGLIPWLLYRDGMPVGYEVFGVICGAMAVVGHNWPLWLRFHGGKGVATSVGVFFALTPLAGACALGVWFVVLALTRIVSISSMIASLSLTGWNLLFRSAWAYTIAGLVLALLIVVMHRANIRRLIRGTELKVFAPAGGKEKDLTTGDTENTE